MFKRNDVVVLEETETKFRYVLEEVGIMPTLRYQEFHDGVWETSEEIEFCSEAIPELANMLLDYAERERANDLREKQD